MKERVFLYYVYAMYIQNIELVIGWPLPNIKSCADRIFKYRTQKIYHYVCSVHGFCMCARACVSVASCAQGSMLNGKIVFHPMHVQRVANSKIKCFFPVISVHLIFRLHHHLFFHRTQCTVHTHTCIE